MKASAVSIVLLLMTFFVVSAANAQTPEPTPEPSPGSELPATHIVQEGETLFTIAELYETTVESLQLLNNIEDPSLIFIGQELNLPGGEDAGVTTIHTIHLGDSLAGLAAVYKTTEVDIASTNWLISTENMVVGKPIIIMSKTGSADPEQLFGTAHVVKPGDTLLTVAAQYGLSPSTVFASNDLTYPTYLFPGQRLRIPSDQEYQLLPGNWTQLELFPLALTQGASATVYLENNSEGFDPIGQFAGQELHFTPTAVGYVAFFGIDAFTDPGAYSIELTDQASPFETFSQDIVIESSNYGLQSITIPDEKADLLAPEIRQNEDSYLASVYSVIEEGAVWEEPFTVPISNTFVTAGYGDARSYNDGPIEIYHSGIDFSGGIGTKIYAPAPGNVVLSETLTLRGNSLIIDHGLGVMTGYYHLSNILVEDGQPVSAGQVIAEGGSTGLSTGPHLHWDLRIHNVPVDPLQWTAEEFLAPLAEIIE